jgi:hypothetical protein
MNDADNTQDRGLTTEQIAAAGSGSRQEDVPVLAGDEGYYDDNEGYADGNKAYADGNEGDADGNTAGLAPVWTASGSAGHGAPGAGDEAPVTAEPGSHAMLLEDGELQGITMRWKDIQAEFVDEPQVAVREADALVADLMQRLAAMFAAERAELEDRWAGGDQVSTEDLRQGLRRYRSFFERLLAA